MGALEFLTHLDNQKYDKTYQDIEVIGYKGYSESYKTWEKIKPMIDWAGKTVTELGSFHGYFCFKAEQEGATAIGFESDPFFADAILDTVSMIKEMTGSTRTSFYHWDSTSDDLIPDSDIILCLNVLHHLSNPEKVLGRLNCTTLVAEINEDQLDMVKKYFRIQEQTTSHRPGRIIIVGVKEVSLLCLDFTNICNYRCLFCEACKGERNLLRLADFKGLDLMIQKAGVIDMSGYGEADVHPDFVELINLLTKYNKRFSFVTNGSLLDKNIDLLVHSSMYLLNVSVNSLNKDTYYKQIGGKGDLSRVLDNIERFYEVDNNYLRPWSRKIRRQFSFVITAYNFHELFDFVDFVKKYKTDEVNARVVFRGLSPTLVYPEGLMPIDNEANRTFLASANEYAKINGLELETFSFDMSRVHRESIEEEVPLSNEALSEIVKKCNIYERCLFIGSDGNVSVCDWIRTREIGNVLTQSIEEIRNGAVWKEFVSCIKRGDLKYCMNCRRRG
jgi:MoaA/NifB/PqqE/SkfB family radical SAM enzyme